MKHLLAAIILLCALAGFTSCSSSTVVIFTPSPVSLPSSTPAASATMRASSTFTAPPELPLLASPTALVVSTVMLDKQPTACPGARPSRLAVGQSGLVSLAPPVANRVRSQPALSAETIGNLMPGERFTVLEGPRCADGTAWWRVRSLNQNLEGWSAEGDAQNDWLMPEITLTASGPQATASSTPRPTPNQSRPDGALIGAGWQLAWSLDTTSLLDLDSGQNQRLPFNAQDVSTSGCWSWSPDGQKLLYANLVHPGGNKTVLEPRVWDVTTGRVTILPAVLTCSLRWHPNSQAVLLANALQEPMLEISSPQVTLLVDAQSGRPLARLPLDSPVGLPSFSPDGRSLVFYRPELPALYRIEVKLDATGQVAGFADSPTRLAVDYGPGNLTRLEWSPSGEWIAMLVAKQGIYNDIYLLNPGSGALVNLTAAQMIQRDQEIRLDFAPWSPDGSRLAFTAYHMRSTGAGSWASTDAQVFVAEISTGKIVEVSGGKFSSGQTPNCWSPDGRVLLFGVYPTRQLVAAWPDGSDRSPLAGPVQANFCAFRPGAGGQPVALPTKEPSVILPLPTLPVLRGTPLVTAAFMPTAIPTTVTPTRTAATPTPIRTATPASSSTAVSSRETWEQLSISGPNAQRGAQAVYNSARQVVILFGGDNGQYLNETWEFNGKSWKQIKTQHSPPARIWHGMAYDAGRQVVVLYGGEKSAGAGLGDTWEYNGTDWQQVQPAHSPGVRGYGPGLTYDSCRKQVILFGGVSGGSEAQSTWAYDGKDWTKISTAGAPPARGLTSLAFDSQRCRAVLFGGNGSQVQADTWEYDGTAWLQIARGLQPTLRWGHAMAYDPLHHVVLFGGFLPSGAGKTNSDTWLYDGIGWTLVRPLRLPAAREQHVLVFDGVTGQVILYGGFGSNETWRLELK